MSRKCAFITGASRGIGRAAALALAAHGYDLVINCREKLELLKETAKTAEEMGASCLMLAGDVSDPNACRRMVSDAKKRFGRIDLLVNNAGIAHIGLLQDMTDGEWDAVIACNLSSVFYLCRAVIPMMLRDGGRIINISSVWGEAGASCEVAYSASKGGVNAFTRALAKELAPSQIPVNAISCGLVDTSMNSHLSAEEMAVLYDGIPAGRSASPEEIAQIVVSLADAPQYLTGQVIRVDGGWL